MSFSCDVRQCSWFEALTADLAAVDHQAGGVLAKSIQRFDDYDNSEMDWLLDRYGYMPDHELLKAHRDMSGFPARISPRQRPMTVGEFNKAMALVEGNMSGAERAMMRMERMTKSLTNRNQPFNTGKAVLQAREAIWQAQQNGEVTAAQANLADLKLREHALRKLNQLRGR